MNNTSNVFEEVKNVIAELSPVSSSDISITGETTLFEELSISSINFVLIIAAIEDKFNITIDLEDIDYSKLNKVNSLVELVERTQKQV